MLEKEIRRNPPTPSLSPQVVERLTDLCFRRDQEVPKSDLIFVFATAVSFKETGDLITHLIKKGTANQIFLTGGNPAFKDSRKNEKPESALMRESFNPSLLQEAEVFTEDRSTNLLGNVVEALKVSDFRRYHKIVFISKSHVAGRAYLTLRKFLNQDQIFQQTVEALYPETDRAIGPSNWFTFAFGRERVWGEFLRIKEYGRRGDIAFDEVRTLVGNIEKSVA